MTPNGTQTGARPDRAKMISVRLTKEEYDVLSDAAAALGVGPSTLARTLIRQGLGAGITGDPAFTTAVRDTRATARLSGTAPATTPGSALEMELAANLLARIEALERWVAEH
ncbi:hypothetical protein GCM10009817_37960 [Terrabacter lapilli]|uniref:Ribbon-helix-helix CopG family protein n=1 Tax=Terrabacter lapilli TaxID=436231 RepID=A0ABP5E7Q9_9MICO